MTNELETNMTHEKRLKDLKDILRLVRGNVVLYAPQAAGKSLLLRELSESERKRTGEKTLDLSRGDEFHKFPPNVSIVTFHRTGLRVVNNELTLLQKIRQHLHNTSFCKLLN